MDKLEEILHEMEDDRTAISRHTHDWQTDERLTYAPLQMHTSTARRVWSGDISTSDDHEALDDFDLQLMTGPFPDGDPFGPNITRQKGSSFETSSISRSKYNGTSTAIPPSRLTLHNQSETDIRSLRLESLTTPPRLDLSRFAYDPKKTYSRQERAPATPTKSGSQTRRNRLAQSKCTFDPTKEFVDIQIPLGSRKRVPANQFEPSSPVAQGPVRGQGAIALGHAPPVVQGITLVPVTRLPDRLRQLFSFELFNAIQSKTFEAVYESNDNVVVSAPTGSGKTTIMELAICKLVGSIEQGSYKVIYQAPTKALCAEKKRDWDKKFSSLGLVCTELTGDTDFHQMSHVKNGDIIITTPEKWDSMTRRWQDHKKLLQMVKLFLVDEIHMLKESRGATLEVVITRMKSIGADVRFIALSATVPNSQDIATWLGKNCAYPNNPAYEARFDEDFRPVKLQKLVYGYNSTNNDFMFDKSLDKMLPDVIKKHSARKPTMIFCSTRQMCQGTAKMLAEHWSKGDHLWPGTPGKNFSFRDRDLQSTALYGVAFHHAGLDQNDRILVEKLFLEGSVFVICCTSTLAVGINMPAYLVILKNTITFADGRSKEYDDLEVMQMLGRAGRPQFDTAGVAVIMTKNENKEKYERMIAGTELVESCLHGNLVEHLNAEIGMGTITDVSSAKLWLKSTFLWVRMKRNPSHYKIQGQTIVMDIEQKLEEICEIEVAHLQETRMVYQGQEGKLKCTPAGIAMATFYIKLETMKRLLTIGTGSKIADILQAISEAQEFKELRMRVNERIIFREINKGLGMKYPLKGDISTTAHKANILIQFELGSMEYPAGEAFQKYSNSLIQDKNFVFQHVHRLIRCLVDCLIETKDAVTLKNALVLAGCLSAKCWENSPNQLRQLDGIGPVTVKKFAMANIRSLSDLVSTEAHKIDMIASRNPPFGANILKDLGNIPNFTITVTQVSKTANRKDPVKVMCRADIGYTNKGSPSRFKGTMIIAYFMAECDGQLLDFRRIMVNKLQGGRDVKFTAEIVNSDQKVTCFVSCESIVGTLKSAEMKLDIDPSLFPPPPKVISTLAKGSKGFVGNQRRLTSDFSRASDLIKQEGLINGPKFTLSQDADEYDDGYFAAAVRDLDFSYIDNIGKAYNDETVRNTRINTGLQSKSRSQTLEETETVEEPIQLSNGNWACKHKCGDKTKCKHICCREGLEKPPKITKKKPILTKDTAIMKRPSLTTLATEKRLSIEDPAVDYIPRLNPVKRNTKPGSSELAKRLKKGGIDFVDLVDEEWQQDHESNEVEKASKPPATSRTHTRVSMANCQPRYTYESRMQPDLSILTANGNAPEPSESEEESNLPSPGALITQSVNEKTTTSHTLLFGSASLLSSTFTDEDLDMTFTNMTEPITITSQKNTGDRNVAKDNGNATVDFESSPPIQYQMRHNRKTEPFFVNSPECNTMQHSDTDDITEHGDRKISNWDTSPTEAHVEPLPGRSIKRLRSRTPDSPLRNRSTRFKGACTDDAQMLRYEHSKNTTDEDLLAFLGDCVEFI